eukprot:11013214-Ditylum_brightwellii.AAC.1
MRGSAPDPRENGPPTTSDICHDRQCHYNWHHLQGFQRPKVENLGGYYTKYYYTVHHKHMC